MQLYVNFQILIILVGTPPASLPDDFLVLDRHFHVMAVGLVWCGTFYSVLKLVAIAAFFIS